MQAIIIFRWIGRILSLLLALILTLAGVILIGSELHNNFKVIDFVVTIFLIALIAGLILSWSQEKTGIILFFAGFTGIVIVSLYTSDMHQYWLLWLTIPTTIILLCRLSENKIDKRVV